VVDDQHRAVGQRGTQSPEHLLDVLGFVERRKDDERAHNAESTASGPTIGRVSDDPASPSPRPGDRPPSGTPSPAGAPPSAAPSVGARVLAFAAILVAGVCGGVIGYAFIDLQ